MLNRNGDITTIEKQSPPEFSIPYIVRSKTMSSPVNKTKPQSAGSGIRSDVHSISIWLDGYDDLFSDFDARPIGERNVSEDFLHELQNVSAEAERPVHELCLLLPAARRSPESEKMITRRLHTMFRENYQYYQGEIRRQRRRGIAFLTGGMMVLILATYISYVTPDKFFMHALLVVLEPAGWFSIWNGFESLFSSTKRENPDLVFFARIHKAVIRFGNI